MEKDINQLQEENQIIKILFGEEKIKKDKKLGNRIIIPILVLIFLNLLLIIFNLFSSILTSKFLFISLVILFVILFFIYQSMVKKRYEISKS